MSDTGKNFIIEINGQAMNPSAIQPDIEIIRNTERALDGTLHIDVVAQKKSLEIVWELVTATEYQSIKARCPLDKLVTVKCFLKTGNSYLDAFTSQIVSGTNSAYSMYPDSISGTPVILENGLYFQNVTVKLVEV